MDIIAPLKVLYCQFDKRLNIRGSVVIKLHDGANRNGADLADSSRLISSTSISCDVSTGSKDLDIYNQPIHITICNSSLHRVCKRSQCPTHYHRSRQSTLAALNSSTRPTPRTRRRLSCLPPDLMRQQCHMSFNMRAR